jgi:triosephosphate isomerase (TIM)
MTVSRTAIIAGNWKMNYGPKQASAFAVEIIPQIGQMVRHYPHLMCILCPPSISLAAVHDVMDAMPTPRLELGAQNLYYEEKGAYTGELSPSMVRELCTTVILGHSERRTYFGETDQFVNRKAHAALKHSLRPIICIGENEAQYETGQTEQVIRAQVQGSLSGFSEQQAPEIVVAYEPIWAIGTGRNATPDDANATIGVIRDALRSLFADTAEEIRIQYGGSVKPGNIAELMRQPEIDGALVGGASLDPDDFARIVQYRR